MSGTTQGTGFFGKVPTLGDFVDRRLPNNVRETLDTWLQGSIAHSQEILGETWLNTYLTSPVWHFALGPGICDQNSWTGILMPSCDKVGRYFPLVIAKSHELDIKPLESFVQLRDWYDRASTLALSCLGDGYAFDEFDAALTGLEYATAVSRPYRAQLPDAVPAGAGLRYGLPEPAVLPDFYPGLIQDLLSELYAAHSVWWSAGSATVPPSLLICQGLPQQRCYTALLTGQWRDCGWSDRGMVFQAGQEATTTEITAGQ